MASRRLWRGVNGTILEGYVGTEEDLLAAVKAGDETAVDTLLTRNPELASARDGDGGSALLTAIYYGRAGIVEKLLAAGAKPGLFEAAALGRLEDVSTALDSSPGAVDSWSRDGFTPLQMAAYFGQPEVISLLLERGADITPASRNPMKVTALHAAAAHHREGHAEAIVGLLIGRGADVNAVQEGGFTALHAAAQNGYAGMARRLLDAGADASATTAAGKTALDFAVEKDHSAVVVLLREHAGVGKQASGERIPPVSS
jgi:ankyrin repeat protein